MLEKVLEVSGGAGKGVAERRTSGRGGGTAVEHPRMCVVILDELDQLLSRHQEVGCTEHARMCMMEVD